MITSPEPRQKALLQHSCSVIQAGLWNAVSVPDGAPPKATPEDAELLSPKKDRKFSYMDTCADLLDEQSHKADVVRPVINSSILCFSFFGFV